MTRSSAPRRDFAAMQERRRRAGRLFAAGKRSQAEIARELHISRQSVSRWFEAWRQAKPDWIRGAGRAGRRPKLDGAQFKQVDKVLRQGAQAHGFATDLWTLPRVAAVIERATGVHFHPGHVWKILGAERGDSGVGLCLQLEEAVDKRGTRLSLGRPAMPAVVSDPARQLQRRTADRFLARSEEALARAEGDSDLGWIACAQEPEDEAVSGEPA